MRQAKGGRGRDMREGVKDGWVKMQEGGGRGERRGRPETDDRGSKPNRAAAES